MIGLDENDSNSVSARAFEVVKASDDVAAAIAAVRDIYEVNHVTYHLAKMIADKYDYPFVRTTYPDAWVARYFLRGYVKVDPVVQEGFERNLPFDWRELTITEPAVELMMDAQAHGLAGHGYSIPIIDKVGRRALLSLNAAMSDDEWSGFIDSHAEGLAEVGFRIHKLALFEQYGEHDPVPRLGHRERECLAWVAQGKEYSDIAIILDLSEHTIRSYTKSARLKLDCSNLAQAVAKAIKLRIIDS